MTPGEDDRTDAECGNTQPGWASVEAGLQGEKGRREKEITNHYLLAHPANGEMGTSPQQEEFNMFKTLRFALDEIIKH